MGKLKELFFLLSLVQISSVRSENQQCPNSMCGNNTNLRIQYPFKKLEDQQQLQNCNYTNINCDITRSTSSIDLPFSGRFYIRSIDYDSSTIVIYDPDNCLPGRLMNDLNLQGSPLMFDNYEYLTFYNCPRGVVGSGLLAIDCLSNSTSTVVVSFSVRGQVMEGIYQCSFITNAKVPLSWLELGGTNGNSLVLRWDVPPCQGCHKDKGIWRLIKFIVAICAITLGLLAAGSVLMLFLMAGFVYCWLQVGYAVDFIRERRRRRTNRTTVARQMTLYVTTYSIPTGLDDSMIKSCSEMVVLDIDENEMTTSENLCCPICLEEYCDKEKVRRLRLCSHCFHAECIDLWLRNNCTCPTCRVSLVDVQL